MKRILTITTMVALTATFVATSCAKQEVVYPTVSLDKHEISLLPTETVTLTATLSSTDNDYVVWASKDAAVATVSQEGVVTGVAPGETKVYAKTEYGGKKDSCTVTVNPILVSGVKLDITTGEVFVGKTITVTATVSPADATAKTLEWSTSDAKIATVANGVVTGVAVGKATITATAKDGSKKSASCTIEVKEPTDLEMWTSDASGSKTFKGGSAKVEGLWITYANGIVSWKENTTGLPRTETIETAGGKITITQISAQDFKGNWDFTTKVFCKDGFVAAGNTVTLPNGIKIGAPRLGETLKDGAGVSHVNALGVDGLYHPGIIAEAAVDIDYAAETVKFGLFMDGRKAQLDANPSDAAYPYIAFLPEACANYVSAASWSSPWFFIAPDLGEPDYEWIWFDVSEDFNTLLYSAAKAQKYCTTNPNNYGPYIIGVSVLSFSAEEASAANAKGGSAVAGGTYNVIYQFNTNAGSVGLKFTRK